MMIATSRWLEDFAYHVDVGVAAFVIAGIAVLIVALASVSYQGMRAARVSPIESLRDE